MLLFLDSKSAWALNEILFAPRQNVEASDLHLVDQANTPSHFMFIRNPRIDMLLYVLPTQHELYQIILKQTFYKFPL